MNTIKYELELAKKYSQKGDEYANQGRYGQASEVYKKVAQIMTNVIKSTNSPETIQVLTQKIKKYEDLRAEMLVKETQKNKKEYKGTRFGFPQTEKATLYNDYSNVPRQPRKIQNSPSNLPNKPSNIPNSPSNVPKIPKDTSSLPNKTSNKDKNIELVDKQVESLIVQNIDVGFDDIVGMKQIKQILYESVIIPKKRPDLFEGIRSPPRGILMYGPPGNGKTMIAKAVAKQAGSTFYNISAASIMNKFVGESQKMLRKVFESAAKTSPSIIFIDQIDSMLTARSQNENQTSRRLKTQFLVQFDGVTTSKNNQVIVIGATNLPNEIDMAALRRFSKLVYIGLPLPEARINMVLMNLKEIGHSLNEEELQKLGKNLEGYSASQVKDIVKEASMRPIRQLTMSKLEKIQKNSLRQVKYEDFCEIIKEKKPLMTPEDLKKYDAKFH